VQTIRHVLLYLTTRTGNIQKIQKKVKSNKKQLSDNLTLAARAAPVALQVDNELMFADYPYFPRIHNSQWRG
jgi:hypothetical protein